MAEKKQPPAGTTEIVPEQELAGGATFTSEPADYSAHDVVIVRCTNATPGPTQPLHVSLELSTDGATFVPGSRRTFSGVEGASTLQAFVMSEVAAQDAWKEYRLVFGSLVGGSVTIAASTGVVPDPPEPPKDDAAPKKGDKEAPAHKGHDAPHHDPHAVKK